MNRQLIASNIGVDVAAIRGDVIAAELIYPRNEGQPKIVEVGLCDVRAADSIRITYDYARDGWSVLQASGWNRDQSAGDVMDWQEVSFVRAWARVPTDEMEMGCSQGDGVRL